MPSRTEGFGLTALEALSAGLPVLVSGNSGLGEALKKVATGSNWIVASEEPKDWAKAICAVQEKGRDIRLEECEILREKYGAKYSWQKQCYSLVEAMQKISFAAFLGLRVECESVKQKEPSSQDEALDSANSARPKEGTKETATTCTAVTNDVAQTGVYIPTSDEIFRLIVMRRLQMVPPSSVQEFEDFNEYMSTVKGIITQDVMLGSLLITVKCRSLQVLEDLWTDYTSGLLNEIVQRCLVTDDVLNDLGLSELKLLTYMREAEYKACKQILQKSG
ncbi:uncharacterized protein LOC110069356 isoform X3 [Orbicella faveolata]|uniref:uncharacterized protein LOC110069356 isoform X3 n=1 Tax=Orbicella faveolata TaxID=48498 RepID=UPI0009E5DAE2|nr:uncharacterized protein LOC110069356 isoform X3 [Orbicella faveolata]